MRQKGQREKGEKMWPEARMEENAQFLKVIERGYVLRMKPLVKEEDIE
jgi:hypothetical protein